MALSGLALYGLHRLWLLRHWYREKKKDSPEPPQASIPSPDACPFVTVQLPLFNERFVATRLLDAAAALQWPKNRLEIQVLDDSTDDTCRIVDERAVFWSNKGITVNVIRRSHRQGYKAGALDHGMQECQGEFIAIFDADFVPFHDFLVRTVPYFADKSIGMVQARWTFLNAEHSWLTAIQSLLLGPHFSIEHWVRSKRNLFFNFNGTAGVWRRKAIESAGGWLADTVTEDLDLSYRAQLAGWRFCYLDSVAVPSELPVTMASFRSQQQRWAKGSIQTARKILPRLFSTNLPVAVKLEAVAHLLANVGWLLGFIVTITLYPTILSRTYVGPHQILRIDAPLFLFSSLAILLYFVLYRLGQKNRVPLRYLLALPVFTIGLAPSIALSVLQGFFKRGGVFDRTPKFGVDGRGKLPVLASLYRQRSLPCLIMNTMLFAYTLLPVFFAVERNTWLAIPFLLVFPLGFLLVLYTDFREFFTVSG
jgi:cellulose synthase/poly-beta-1,6-N-acetylglucosamine synthase-like glycosyltransferase